jgi:hypothetical protein
MSSLVRDELRSALLHALRRRRVRIEASFI